MAVTRTGGASNNTGGTGDIDLAFTLPGSSDCLVFMASAFSSSTTTSVTWKPDSGNAGADQSFTKIYPTDGSNARVHIWALLNPTATVTGSVIRHVYGVSSKRVIGCHSLGGVGSIGTPTGTTGSDDLSVDVASVVDALVLDVVYGTNSTGTYTAGANQTERWDAGTSGGVNNCRGGSSQETGAAGNITMSWVTPTTTTALAGVSFNPPDPDTEVDAELATGTGSALNALALVAPNAGASAGSGQALDATALTAALPNAELASGAGSSLGPSAHIAPNAEAVGGAGAAYDATVSTGSNVTVDAQIATGTGAAFGPSPSVSPSAGAGAGTGAAGGLLPHVKPGAGVAAGTGAAHSATVSIGSNVSVNAELAAGTGAAPSASPSIAPHPGIGTGTGSATQPTAGIMALGVAAGTGSAHDAVIWADDNYDAVVEGDIATGYLPPLAAPIDDDDTTITVEYPSTTDPDVPFVVLIDDEEVLVTDVTGTTWTVERGYSGTTATAHGSGTVARPSLVRIRVDGVLISPHVDYRRSRFTTGANGQAGTAEIWVRDLNRTRSFTTGAEVRVSFRGVLQWGGYVSAIRRQYVFPAGTGRIGEEPRWLLLDCVDYNVLFNKRVFFKLGNAEHMAVKHWPNGTWDSVVISDLVRDYLTLDDDNLRYDIQHVGTPALPQISCNPDAPDKFGIGSAGWTWGDVMNAIVSQTGAVYYIDPDRVFRYVDDSDKQSRFGWDGLSDHPDNVTTIGYRDVEFTSDGTRLINDHYQWGAGQGSSSMVFSHVEDEDSIAVHGRWQSGELRFDLWCEDSVDQRAETWVYGSPQNRRGGKDDRFFSRVTVREPYFRVADVVALESQEFGFTRTVPIRNSEITFPTPWDIRCVLTLAHELDAPWNTFEFWFPQFDLDLPSLGLPELPDLPGLPDPWGPLDPCQEAGVECVVVDTFTRSGASLGTSDSGHTWGVPIGITNTYTPTTDGSEAILQVEAGFSTSTETTHTGSGRLNLVWRGRAVRPDDRLVQVQVQRHMGLHVGGEPSPVGDGLLGARILIA